MDSHGASSEDSSSLSAFKITQQRGVDHLHAHVSDQLYTRIKTFSFYTVYAAASGRHYARLAMMELVKVVLIVVLLLTNVFCQELDYDSWREGIAEKWPHSEVIEDILVRMSRKPGPRQYLGLLRRKDSAKSQTARKRHKFQTFVGLMGKRSFEDQGAL